MERLRTNDWWPFTRVEPKLLEKLHKQKTLDSVGEAPL
jgi:hypothetical protein